MHQRFRLAPRGSLWGRLMQTCECGWPKPAFAGENGRALRTSRGGGRISRARPVDDTLALHRSVSGRVFCESGTLINVTTDRAYPATPHRRLMVCLVTNWHRRRHSAAGSAAGYYLIPGLCHSWPHLEHGPALIYRLTGTGLQPALQRSISRSSPLCSFPPGSSRSHSLLHATAPWRAC
jgi:hypothetical protein